MFFLCISRSHVVRGFWSHFNHVASFVPALVMFASVTFASVSFSTISLTSPFRTFFRFFFAHSFARLLVCSYARLFACSFACLFACSFKLVQKKSSTSNFLRISVHSDVTARLTSFIQRYCPSICIITSLFSIFSQLPG